MVGQRSLIPKKCAPDFNQWLNSTGSTQQPQSLCHIYRKNMKLTRSRIVSKNLVHMIKSHVSNNRTKTHYFAESLSWYSLDLLKQYWTPVSVHNLFMAANKAGVNGSVSMCRAVISNSIIASLWRGREEGRRKGRADIRMTTMKHKVAEREVAITSARHCHTHGMWKPYTLKWVRWRLLFERSKVICKSEW